MMKLAAIALLVLVPFGASAQQGPQIPDEATKTWALKRAYQLNGNSMVGWGSIDLSGEVPAKSVRVIPIVPKSKKVDR